VQNLFALFIVALQDAISFNNVVNCRNGLFALYGTIQIKPNKRLEIGIALAQDSKRALDGIWINEDIMVKSKVNPCVFYRDLDIFAATYFIGMTQSSQIDSERIYYVPAFTTMMQQSCGCGDARA
jgi:hypothetical protein